MERRKIRIGTRGSALALYQANYVQAALLGPSEIVIVRTTGDQRQDVPLDQAGGVGLFTKEIERALLDGRIDLAVHSLKDLPVELPAGLALGAVPLRAAVSDVLLVRPDALDSSQEFPVKAGSRVGTSATRRRSASVSLGISLPKAIPTPCTPPSRLKSITLLRLSSSTRS